MAVSKIKGVDYTESFVPTILAMSIKVFLAIGTYLHYDFYHLDIGNAFQNTPAPPNEAGNRIWLRVFPEYILWFQTRFPTEYASMTKTLPAGNKYPWKTLGVEMFAHVQGRKDASREWGEHIDKVICGELGLVKNRSDQCIYQGIINTHHVIMARATDDIIIGSNTFSCYYVQSHCCHLRISLEGS